MKETPHIFQFVVHVVKDSRLQLSVTMSLPEKTNNHAILIVDARCRLHSATIVVRASSTWD